jgi:hypothetical protein
MTWSSPSSPRRLGFTALCVAALAITGTTQSSARTVEKPRPPQLAAVEAKSLVIGVDGATFSKLAPLDLPNIEALQSAGSTSPSNLYANPMAPTYSGPGWATIATGVWPDKHKVVDNSFTGRRFDLYPDYLTRLERASSAFSTLAVVTWSPIATTVLSSAVDSRVQGGSDAGTTQRAVDALRSGDPDSTFVHLDDVDHAGHDHGAASPEYATALRDADQRIGQLVSAVQSRATYASESWLIIVTADHGHTNAGGHGGNAPQERETFVIARGGGNVAGQVGHSVKITDVAPSVLAHHGVARSTSWGLDGLPTTAVTDDAFDGLYGSLRSAVDESTSLPKGWTTTAPSGWSIDNSAMPTGGVTEWRGWSFATDEFWTNAALGQGRETNVRARKVFAVADSDEWDDKTHASGQFDSTLVSPSYSVSGRSTMNLSFATTYAIDGPQSAQVLVSWDGAAPTQVRSYTTAMNRFESISIPVPAGAQSAKVRFRYTGTNSAFWTVDQVKVSTS